VDGNGNVTENVLQTYDGPGGKPTSSANITSSTDAIGNTTESVYNAANQVYCSVDAADVDAADVICPSSPPTSVPAPDSRSTTYLGATITYYDGDGNVIATTDPLGYTSVTSYTPGGGSVPEELPYCTVDAEEYSVADKTCPTSAPTTPPTGATGYTTTIYDSAGYVTSTTNANGGTTSYAYGLSNPELVSSQTDPDGDVTTYSYNGAGQVTKQVETAGAYSATTVTAYDSAGRTYCTIVPLAYAEGDTSCPAAPTSPPTAGTDLWPGATITIFDAAGQPTYSVNPLGGVTETAYDPAGQVYCTVDPNEYAAGTTCPAYGTARAGATITSYNTLGQAVQVTNPLGGITLTTYDLAGNTVETSVESSDSTDDPNVVTENAYDGDNRVVSSTIGYGSSSPSTTLTSYDPDGNVYCTVSGNNSATDSCPVWEPGWIVTPPNPSALSGSPGVTTTFYDADGNKLQTTDPDGQTTVTAVDADGRTTCTWDPSNADPWLVAHTSATYPYQCPSPPDTSPPTTATGYITTIYDAAGNTLSTTDQLDETTSYTYDAAGDKTQMTDPRGYSTNYCYDYEDGTGQCAANPPPSWGGPWDDVDGDHSLLSVSCPTTTFCMAVDLEGGAVEYNGSTWTTFPSIDGSNGLESVSCPTTTFCMAVDDAGNIGSFNGTSWTPFSSRDGSRFLESVSCPTTSFCVAVDDSGWIGTWTPTPTPTWTFASKDSGTGIESVSCASTTFCLAGDDAGKIDTWGGSSWSGFATPLHGDGSTVQSISCVSSSFCALRDYDQTGIYTTSGWSFTSAPTEFLGSMSCASSSFCISADYLINSSILIYNGSGWTTTTLPAYQSGNGTAFAVSCPAATTVSFCAAVGNYGSAILYQPGSGPADSVYSETTPPPTTGSAGETTTYAYAPGGDTVTTTTPAGQTFQSYDAMGDEIATSSATTASGYSTVPTVSTTYNHDGSRASMTDGNGTTTYTEDAAGDVTGQQFVPEATSTQPASTVGYTYYSTGALKGVVYPSYGAITNTTATYTYDALGNMASETDWLGQEVKFAHDADDIETAQCNDVTSTTACTSSTPAGTSYSEMSYDPADENSGVQSTLACGSGTGTLTQNFSSGGTIWRNPDGQLTQDSVTYGSPCSGSVPARDYSYDAAGRIVYQGATAGTNFAYDADGDPTMMSNTQGGDFYGYTDAYDHADEVTSQTPVVSGDGSTSTYTYDTLGDQATGTSGSSTTTYAYDQVGQLTGTSGDSTAAYAYTGDGLEATATPTASGWSSAASADSGHVIEAVSCPTTSMCVAVDNHGQALQWNGSTWTATSSMEDGTNPIEAVSCPTTSMCMAVDNGGNADLWSGSTWTLSSTMDGARTLTSVSCPTTTACVAVDSSGYVATWNGSTWSVSSASIDSHGFNAVSCVTPSDCQAVDSHGRAYTNTGTGWSSTNYIDIDATHALESVSCSGANFCQAVDNDGKAVSFNGLSWTVDSGIDGTRTFASISCATASFCVAVDNAGAALTYDGSAWSSTTPVDPANTPEALSCPTESFCDLVDSGGKAFTYTASDLTWDTNGSLPTVLSDGTDDYLYGPSGEPVEQISTTAIAASVPTFMTFTPSDSSWLLTNAAGDETAFYDYDAFGTLSLGTPGSSFGYAGQYQGTSANASGLENMQARWYDSQTGEFTTRDPDFSQTDQAYAYAGDDPVNGSDPTGLWCIFGHNPNGGCRGTATVVNAWHNTDHAWDCLTSACYASRTGAANAVAGAHNTLNYVSGLPPVAIPYPCSNSDAYALGGQLPYLPLLLVPGAGEAEFIEVPLNDGGAEAAAEEATGYSPANLGQSYGGRVVVNNPDLQIEGFQGSANPSTPFHGLNQAIERGVSPQDILGAVVSPTVVLEQGGGASYLFLTDNAAVALRADGQVITVWGSAQFNPTTIQILQDAHG
jgi:RHS repeat-associated protein